jgi:hypothetical protein
MCEIYNVSYIIWEFILNFILYIFFVFMFIYFEILYFKILIFILKNVTHCIFSIIYIINKESENLCD